MRHTKQKGQPRTLQVTRPAFERDYTTPSLAVLIERLDRAHERVEALSRIDYQSLSAGDALSDDQKAELLGMYQNEKL